MRALISLVLVVGLGWSGYWFVAARGLNNAVETALAQTAGQAVHLNAADYSVQGFPNRLDLTFDTPAVSGHGFTWSAPFFQALALSYQPNHLILVWPNTQTLHTHAGLFRIESEDMRASIRLGAALSLPLNEATFAVKELRVHDSAGDTAALQSMVAAIRADEAGENAYRLGLAAHLLTFDGPLAAVAPLRKADLDGVVTFDRALDRTTPETGARPLSLDLTRFQVDWGTSTIILTALLTFDDAGRISGQAEAKVKDWEAFLRQLENTGAVQADQMDQLRNVATMMANGSDTVTVPITLRNGAARVGPFPVGILPPVF